MKISTRTRYGLRAILELASHYDQGPLQLRTIASHQDISAKYLEQLISLLKSAGLVSATRGAKGGYTLAREPKQVKIIDVFTALEGPLATVGCLEKKDYCVKVADCAARNLWAQLQQAIMNTLESQTIQDLLDRAQKNRKSDYQI